MSFHTPEYGIRHYDEIPVVCSACGVQSTWTDLSQDTKEALIEASSFCSLTNELTLLNRLADLLTRFPNTQHPLIHNKRRVKKRTRLAEPDPRVDEALSDDPELNDFLTNSGFDVDARLAFVEKRLKTLERIAQRDDIACRICGAYSFLPEDFVWEVGSYLERLAEDSG